MTTRIARLWATFFYIGEFPVAPGTLASAAAVLLAGCVYGQTIFYVGLTVVVALTGIWASGIMEKASDKKDPGFIVIDEVAGILVSFFLVPLSWPVVVAGFFLFRAFDMFKIYPANKFEDMGGGWGVVADDLVAGIYTNVVLQIAIRFAYV